ncbi:hypothetical protein MM300_19210 [Evansella sp. LMS18]|uniref:hypothetical protein n=1 Tax=Evansella sp. LMS18 TaxID=2924033 RepID=UPI0020D0CD5A|nr:hypothetical protein [Evansella sp. LMS18]UTR09985.1 hypothetical protein MM300_19210 [Evansella sp. LMS18]
MDKKQLISFGAVVVVILFISVMFREPAQSELAENDEEEDPVPEFSTIEYINLEGKNRELKRELEVMENELFDMNFSFMKVIIEGGLLNEMEYFEFDELLFTKVTDDEYIVFLQVETEYYLLWADKETRKLHNFYFSFLDHEESFNWTGGAETYSGFANDQDIETVQVIQNGEVYEGKFITVNDDMRIWFSVIDFEWKSINEEPDEMEVKALDKDGNILWHEEFDGPLGG